MPLESRERAKHFAASTIRLFVKFSKSRAEVVLCAKQMLRAGASVGAHVREASRARSDAEFTAKLGGALQEADETLYWLELLREECGIDPALTKAVETEANELIAIITTMIRRTRQNP